MPKISLIINCDTRPTKNHETGLFSGISNLDFLTDGIFNKINFFKGFDLETIVFVDKHQDLPEKTFQYLNDICDTVVIRKHTSETNFNDWNYLNALSLARGEIICHADQDTAMFTASPEPVHKLIELLDKWDYVSYPSFWSPLPVQDNTFDHVWASTRFFMCKRETLDFTEIRRCFDYDYWCKTYPVNRKCAWLEHWLGSISKFKGKGVYYPPIELEKYAIFSWGKYDDYILRRLNEYTYEEVKQWICQHPIHYPCDVDAV